MPERIRGKIIDHVKSPDYTPLPPQELAAKIAADDERMFPRFQEALKALVAEGRVAIGEEGMVVLPTERRGNTDEIVGTYRQNRKGFGFVIPTDPDAKEDLFVPEGSNTAAAITGDVVRGKIISRSQRDGKTMITGKITEVIERKNKRFVGTLERAGQQWFVMPDGNTFIEPIYTPDAATRYIKPGTKVVVEITEFPNRDEAAMGVISEVLGQEGDKDVDLKTIIAQFGLPGEFPEEVKDQASAALAAFKAEMAATHGNVELQEQNSENDSSRTGTTEESTPTSSGRSRKSPATLSTSESSRSKVDGNPSRLDFTDELVCTIDPDDAKDYDDAISLTRLPDGRWELGVHIADVSYFVPPETPLDVEAKERGNSTYFPGYVIPMLPEVLSNGICSLQEGVPRMVKSAFIVFGSDAKPVSTRFSNSIIKSRKRLRYREAQAIIDGADVIPHPLGDRKLSDYEPEIIEILGDMNTLSRHIQKRRHAAGQLVLNLPKMELVLDENGKVVDAIPEDHSFTHTLIEMFMVEANEAVARLLDAIEVPFLRRTHPEPDTKASDRLRAFTAAAGHQIPEVFDRHVVQTLLAKVSGTPEEFAINLAVLRSFTRAEYSPKTIGHFALASQHYCHFTSPIRRYADLTIHRLLDAWFAAIGADFSDGPIARGNRGTAVRDVPTFEEAVAIGKQISYTERRSEDAERELRQVKLLELMSGHVGEEFTGVVTGVTNFGLFIQIQQYMIEGLNRYTELLDDWWEVDEKAGAIKGRRTGKRIRIGDVVKIRVAKVDVARRELDLSVVELLGRGKSGAGQADVKKQTKIANAVADGGAPKRGNDGQTKRNQRSKTRDRKKGSGPRREKK